MRRIFGPPAPSDAPLGPKEPRGAPPRIKSVGLTQATARPPEPQPVADIYPVAPLTLVYDV